VKDAAAQLPFDNLFGSGNLGPIRSLPIWLVVWQRLGIFAGLGGMLYAGPPALR